MTECVVDGCYDDAMEDGLLCESHEVAEYEDVWPDFHDEAPDAWEDYSGLDDSDLWDEPVDRWAFSQEAPF
jgi:hypothetical protein